MKKKYFNRRFLISFLIINVLGDFLWKIPFSIIGFLMVWPVEGVPDPGSYCNKQIVICTTYLIGMPLVPVLIAGLIMYIISKKSWKVAGVYTLISLGIGLVTFAFFRLFRI